MPAAGRRRRSSTSGTGRPGRAACPQPGRDPHAAVTAGVHERPQRAVGSAPDHRRAPAAVEAEPVARCAGVAAEAREQRAAEEEPVELMRQHPFAGVISGRDARAGRRQIGGNRARASSSIRAARRACVARSIASPLLTDVRKCVKARGVGTTSCAENANMCCGARPFSSPARDGLERLFRDGSLDAGQREDTLMFRHRSSLVCF